MAIEWVLFDLDGVLRQFDPDEVTAIELEHGLTPGSIEKVAFQPDVLTPVITGQISRAQWVEAIGEAIESPIAARRWALPRGTVDEEVLSIADDVRAKGKPVGILTNGTDTIAGELSALGIDDHFDVVFNSADIGAAKPDEAVYRHVCHHLDVEPSSVFFTDDSEAKLAGAVAIGIDARVFVSPSVLRSQLRVLGLVDPG